MSVPLLSPEKNDVLEFDTTIEAPQAFTEPYLMLPQLFPGTTILGVTPASEGFNIGERIPLMNATQPAAATSRPPAAPLRRRRETVQ